MNLDSGVIAGIVIAVVIFVVASRSCSSAVNIVQQGEVGVVKRLGEYRERTSPAW